MLPLAEKAFRPAEIPFPVMNIETGHDFPEVIEFRDLRGPSWDPADHAPGGGEHQPGPGGRADRPPGQPEQAADRHPARRHRGAPLRLRCSAARGATRRRPGPRSGCSPSAMRSASGTRKTSAPNSGTSTTRGSGRGEHIRVFPLSNWTELDVWEYIERENLEIPSIYYATRARGVRAGRHPAGGQRVPDPGRRRGSATPPPSATGRSGDMTITGAVMSTRDDGGRRDRRGRRDPRHRTRRDPGRRPGQRGRDGRPQAGRLLLTWTFCGSPPPARSTTASPPSSAGCCSIPRPSSRTSSRRSNAPPDRGGETSIWRAHRRPAGRTRTRHHDRRRLPLLRHAAAEVHHRRHAGPRPIHPEHGHRRLHRQPGHRPGGRAQGLIEQSRRHAFIATLLGIPHLVLAVNKMDLVDTSSRSSRIRAEFTDFATKLEIATSRSSLSPRSTATTLSERSRTCRGMKGRPCWIIWSTCTSPRTGTSSTCGSRFST